MKTYRAYTLSFSGKIVRGEWIEAPDLDDARATALGLCDPGCGSIEIWDGPNRLDVIECAPALASRSA